MWVHMAYFRVRARARVRVRIRVRIRVRVRVKKDILEYILTIFQNRNRIENQLPSPKP